MAIGTKDGLHNHSLGELLKRLSDQVTSLLRQEVELAKAEVGEKGKETARAGAYFGIAAILGLLALGALTAFLILALDGAIPNWAAALVVGVALAAVAAAVALAGRNRLREAAPPVPSEAVESTKEDIQWAKTRLQSGRR
jgi:uncharacterized membrane protein YqjE